MPVTKRQRGGQPLTRYEDDVVLWAQEQAHLIRTSRFSELDLEHLADEIEDVGKSEKRELANRMAVLVSHLLKWRNQPERRSASWEATIKDQRKRIEMLLKETPSLRSQCLDSPEWAEGVWLDARTLARKDMRAKDDRLPPMASWSMQTVCDPAFWPEMPISPTF